MKYQNYNFFINQFRDKKRVSCAWEDHEIWIEKKLPSSQWQLSMKLADREEIPVFLIEMFLGRSSFQWQSKGAYLHLDRQTGCMYLIQDVASVDQYLSFKALMQHFTGLASIWRSSLQESIA